MKLMVRSMNKNTNNTSVKLGQKVQFTAKNEPYISTEIKPNQGCTSVSIVRKNNGTQFVTKAYIHVNFDDVKKKDIYKRFNEILGER